MTKAVVKRISSSGKRASEVSQKGLAEAPHTPVQGDLFSLDSPLRGGVRGERSLMAYPFFALSKNAWKTQLRYTANNVTIEVNPGHRGVATIYDKEVLLYIASLMASRLEEGGAVGQDFQFTGHDLFRVTGTPVSAKAYNRLFESLERLQSTQIKTDIETGGEGVAGFFSWVENVQLKYSKSKDGTRRLKAVRVRLCDWLHRAIMKDRDILKYAPAYFQLSPVNRRLYEVASASCIDGPVSLTLGDLRLQTGYQSPCRSFKRLLKDAAEQNAIPGFTLYVEEQPGARMPVADDRITIVPVPISQRESDAA